MGRINKLAGAAQFVIAIAAAVGIASSAAAAESFAVGAKAGTSGLGVEGTLRMSQSINLRGGHFAYDYPAELEETSVRYDGDLRLQNTMLLADWHPFQGRFRLSAGGIHTRNEFNGIADSMVEVGDASYPVTLAATAGWSGVKPYLGIGFGNAFGAGRWSFSSDLGVMFTGAPEVVVDSSDNAPLLLATFHEELAREEAELREELSDIKAFPVLSLGFAYRF
jgi:hypothetical protein